MVEKDYRDKLCAGDIQDLDGDDPRSEGSGQYRHGRIPEEEEPFDFFLSDLEENEGSEDE